MSKIKISNNNWYLRSDIPSRCLQGVISNKNDPTTQVFFIQFSDGHKAGQYSETRPRSSPDLL